MRDRLRTDMPAEFAALLANLDHSISQGTEDRVTDTVERLTGRPARSFREHLAHEGLGPSGLLGR